MKCVNEKMRNNRSTEWELNVKFEITTIYFLKGVICQLSIKTQYRNKNKVRTLNLASSYYHSLKIVKSLSHVWGIDFLHYMHRKRGDIVNYVGKLINI